MSDVEDTDVLIVGAGPVGLFLANECARRGLAWRLIEKRPGQSQHSRALAIFPRTLEIFDMAGLVAPFLSAANRVTQVAVVTRERVLARLQFTPEESPYRFVAMVPQNVTEALLVAALSGRGGAVEYDSTLVALEAHADRVLADIAGSEGRRQLRARFVVGCDGAHSAVRHLLDIPFAGGQYAATFLLADVATNAVLPADEMQLCPSEAGPVAIFPMSATRRRVVATIGTPVGEAPSLPLVREILAHRAPAGVETRELHWSSYFTVHHRHVERLRAGRIFLAGDAAHIHSPFGGQGMNTGLHDVWNLVWKLDLYLRGLGSEALLDSYGAERLPVIESVIATTDRLTKVMATPGRLVQALRDAVIPMVSRLAPFQHAFVQRLSELGISYGGSPIIEGPGERCFAESLRGGGIHSRFVLLVGADSDPADQAAARELSAALGNVLEARAVPGGGLTLVRPDGYVAYRAPPGVVALNALRTLLERQTRPGRLMSA